MKKDAYNVAVVGATGAVGKEILTVMQRRNFPVADLKLLASARSAGTSLTFKEKNLPVEELTMDAFGGVDFAFFSAGATRSREFAGAATNAGAVVVDNSSAFRMREDIPLVIPEVNAQDMETHNGIIANPNCCAAILGVALWPLHQAAGIKRITVATYQSASGAGAKAMDELISQTRRVLDGHAARPDVFPHQCAFNVFSHNSQVEDNGFNDEENKLVQEIQKIFHLPNLPILATCVRVPVLRAHSEAVTIETEKPLAPDEAKRLLEKAPGVRVVDNAKLSHFPMPIEATDELDVLVGRIRKDPYVENSLALFVSGDQLLKGAAWNAVQIAEELIKRS